MNQEAITEIVKAIFYGASDEQICEECDIDIETLNNVRSKYIGHAEVEELKAREALFNE